MRVWRTWGEGVENLGRGLGELENFWVSFQRIALGVALGGKPGMIVPDLHIWTAALPPKFKLKP